MEKTIDISGRPVQFKCTGSFLLKFKRLVGKDPIKSIIKLNDILPKGNKNGKSIEINKFTIDDFELLYEIAWVLAKTADDTIPDMIDWIDSFEEFPIADIIVELVELLQKAFSSTLTMNNKKK